MNQQYYIANQHFPQKPFINGTNVNISQILMTLNYVYITLCMHVRMVACVCACVCSTPVICPSVTQAVYCDAVDMLFDG